MVIARGRAVEDDADMTGRSLEELVAMVVRTRKAPPDLLERAGGIDGLARADALEIAAFLEQRDLDAPHRVTSARRTSRAVMNSARAVAAAFELGRRAEIARARPRARLTSAAEVAAWAAPRISTLTHEELWMLALDGRGHLRAARCVAKGGLHGAAVRAGDPLRAALRADASAFVLVHNHPSGDPTPSREDIAITKRVALAAEIASVPMLDHVVVARSGFACVPVTAATDDVADVAAPTPRHVGDGSDR